MLQNIESQNTTVAALNQGLTSVNVKTSRPTPLGLNFTLRTPHPGAFPDPRPQSHGDSYSHPLAPPDGWPRPLLADDDGEDVLDLSVCTTFRGFVLLTSHTTTTPS